MSSSRDDFSKEIKTCEYCNHITCNGPHPDGKECEEWIPNYTCVNYCSYELAVEWISELTGSEIQDIKMELTKRRRKLFYGEQGKTERPV